MSELSYLTRGGDSPVGKTNILLLSHPNDVSLAINTVCADVLSILDAAIWYFEDGSLGDCRLDEVNLVVIPVTNALVRSFSPICDVYYEVRARNIAMLPILIESVAPGDYERVFGSVQYLDRVSRDMPVDYRSKLSEHLSLFEMNASLRERIESELDAGIFLSYRHVDRAEAKRLMREIHDVPYLRDVAIWYDDRLTAGKDFNDEILDSVRAADVFVLSVTPSLLDEGNYVVSKEYPAAVAASVPVLPVGMLDTDADLLSKMYVGIPEVCSLDSLGDALVELLSDKLNRNNDTNAEHLYYVGLAYVMGVCVEVDHARGIELLKQSASLGYTDAKYRLAYIYGNGEGVEANKQLAAEYACQYGVDCEKQYNADMNDIHSIIRLASAYSWVISYLDDLDGVNVSRALIDDSVKLSERWVRLTANAASFKQCIKALRRAASYHYDNGDSKNGLAYLYEAKKYAKILYEELGESWQLELYIKCIVELASRKMFEDDTEAARVFIIDALEILDDACDKTPAENRTVRELAARVYDILGWLCYKISDYESAISAYRRSNELYDGLMSFDTNELYPSFVYDNNKKIFDCLLWITRLDEAEAQLELLCKSGARLLASRPDDYKLNYDIKYLLASAELESARKKHKLAEQIVMRAEKLARENEELVWQTVFSDIHHVYTYVYNAWGKWHLSDYHKAILLENYTKNTVSRGDLTDYHLLAATYPTPSVRADRKERIAWKRYKELAKKGRLAFWPDDSHLEKERDVHLQRMLVRGITSLVFMALFALYLFLDLKYSIILKDPMQVLFAFSVMYFYVGETPCEIILYFWLRARRRASYSALWAFKLARVTKMIFFVWSAVYIVFAVAYSVVAFVFPELIAGASVPLIGVGLTVTAFISRLVTDFMDYTERERLRAFLRISRLKPLSEQPE